MIPLGAGVLQSAPVVDGPQRHPGGADLADRAPTVPALLGTRVNAGAPRFLQRRTEAEPAPLRRLHERFGISEGAAPEPERT